MNSSKSAAAAAAAAAATSTPHRDQQQQQQQQQHKPSSLVELGMTPGDMVLLSLDGLHTAVGRVTIHEVGATWVTVASRKEVLVERYQQQWRELAGGPGHAHADAAAAQGAAMQPHAAMLDASASGSQSEAAAAAACWRLDKDEIASMSVTLRTSLLRLVLDGGSARAARLRALLIDLAAPRMHSLADTPGAATQGEDPIVASASACSTPGASTGLRLRLRLEAAERCLRKREGAGLNTEQAAAVRRVAGAEDYALVLGMPGTGKTSTIAAAIRALAAAGASVLVSAYTNSAVDNILLKLARLGVPFIRLGRQATAHPEIHRHMPGGAAYPDRSTAALAAVMDRVKVVGVPCLSTSSPLLAGRRYDVAVIDEAGQITLPAVLGPLMISSSFVLVRVLTFVCVFGGGGVGRGFTFEAWMEYVWGLETLITHNHVIQRTPQHRNHRSGTTTSSAPWSSAPAPPRAAWAPASSAACARRSPRPSSRCSASTACAPRLWRSQTTSSTAASCAAAVTRSRRRPSTSHARRRSSATRAGCGGWSSRPAGWRSWTRMRRPRRCGPPAARCSCGRAR